MAVFEIQGRDGKVYEVDAPDAQAAAAAVSQMLPPQRNPDGTYGQPPEGVVMNPRTGQMEDLRSPVNPNVPTGTGAAAVIGGGQGLGFGSFDEAVAGARSLAGGDYDYDLARIREADRRAQEDNPAAYYGALIPGAVASSVGAGKALGINPTGKNLLDTMGRGLGIGAGEGALWGFANGEGIEGRLKQGGKDALIGAGLGAAAPGVVAAGGAGIRAIGDFVGGLANVGNSKRANRAIIDVLRKAGVSVDDVAEDVARAAREGQPEYRVMDATGKAGQRKASGIVRAGDDGAEELAQFLEQRQLDQGDRVAGFVDDAFETRGTTAAKAQATVKENRKNVTDALYDQAKRDAAPVDVRDAVAQLDETISKMTNSGIKPPRVVKEFQKLRAKLAGQTPDGDPTTLSDYESVLGIWREVRDDVTRAFKDGKGDVGEALKPIRDSLQSALENSSDLYRSATDLYREGARVLDSFDVGKAMSKSGRAADNVSTLAGMTDQQRRAARIGYGDSMLEKLEKNAAPTANKAKPFTSSKVRTESESLATDPGLFSRRISREGDMWETQNRALGGSRTADNLQDVADTGAVADMARAARDVSTGNIGNALANIGGRVARTATGQNEATRALIAKMLMSSDPRVSLAAAAAQKAASEGRNRIAESLLRAIGRSAF